MTDRDTLADDLRALFDEVQVLCGGLDDDLPDQIAAIDDQFTDDELHTLLTTVLVLIRAGGEATAADRVRIAGQVRSAIESAVARRHEAEEWAEAFPAAPDEEAGPASATDDERTHLPLFEYDGFQVRGVQPLPTFLGRTIALQEGFANTSEVAFWEKNRRLDIDLENFRRREGREPDRDELKNLLWPTGSTAKGDPYKIAALADDIAARGVMTPPVIDYWGTAWDGNRRLAACLYVIASSEYDEAQKERARKVRVWQTDQHATKDQIEAIVTSLNFGEDFKLPWPEYVRARQVYDAYVDLRDIEASRRTLTDRDETRIRKRVADKFGIKTHEVTRYCKMVTWALEFEDFHREQERDENEISTRTSELFQYFFELDAGRGEDKLASRFEGDPAFRAIVFDLMFDGKIRSFPQVRELRRAYDTPQALDLLKEAHSEPSRAIGQEKVSDAIFLARRKSTEVRQAGRADELGRVAKWLKEEATLSVLEKVDVDVLRDFRDAARAVDGMISSLVDTATSATPVPDVP
jgi:hypothetical protein